MRRHQLTDEQWSIVEPLIPKKHAHTGRPPADARQMLDGIMWILRTGARGCLARSRSRRFAAFLTTHSPGRPPMHRVAREGSGL